VIRMAPGSAAATETPRRNAGRHPSPRISWRIHNSGPAAFATGRRANGPTSRQRTCRARSPTVG
jgi:hypothetical protein